MSDNNERVGRHAVHIDELGRIHYYTIVDVPQSGVLIVTGARGEQRVLLKDDESKEQKAASPTAPTAYKLCSLYGGSWISEAAHSTVRYCIESVASATAMLHC